MCLRCYRSEELPYLPVVVPVVLLFAATRLQCFRKFQPGVILAVVEAVSFVSVAVHDDLRRQPPPGRRSRGRRAQENQLKH